METAAERDSRLNAEAQLRSEIEETIKRMHNSRGLMQGGVFSIPVRYKGKHIVDIRYDWKKNIPELTKIYYLVVPVEDIVKSVKALSKDKATAIDLDLVVLESLKIDLKNSTQLANAAAEFRAKIHTFILNNIEPLLDTISEDCFKDGMSKETAELVAQRVDVEFSKEMIFE